MEQTSREQTVPQDDMAERFMRKFRQLSLPKQREFYIAACEPDMEYERMLESVADESWKRDLQIVRGMYK